METVLAIVGTVFALTALVVGVWAVSALSRVSKQLLSVQKDLQKLEQKLATQDRAIQALQARAQPPKSLEPIANTLLGYKNRGIANTLFLVGLQVLSQFWGSRKGNRAITRK